MANETSSLEIRSTVRNEGVLEVALARVPVADPKPTEVIVRIEAAPINPSDLGLLFGGADASTANVTGTGEQAVVSIPLAPNVLRALAGRAGQSLPVGNEGAGVVVRAGASPEAQALVGKTVGMLGGAMYAEYRRIEASQCLVLPEGTTAAEGAACFVNPLTVLGMVGTMRAEGHTALVHTAAASNLGQMLVKLCREERIPLVNIVRKPEQVTLLKGLGAEHVLDSTTPTFREELTNALDATGATLAFDAIGGGRMASDILTAMETALNRKAGGYSRYGSTAHKQVYIYGVLDTSRTELARNYGMAWAVGGWLLMPFLKKIGPQAAAALQQRVAREVKTTFASHYSKRVSLAGMLRPEEIAVYAAKATGAKYLVEPQRRA